MRRTDVAIAVILRDAKLLIAQRGGSGPMPGYWEFPGGKCDAGETVAQCLERELWEELNIRVKPVMSFPPIIYTYPHAEVCLYSFLCLHEAGEPQPIECAECRWIEPHQLRDFKFPEANTSLIDQIISLLPAREFKTAEQPRERHRPAFSDRFQGSQIHLG